MLPISSSPPNIRSSYAVAFTLFAVSPGRSIGRESSVTELCSVFLFLLTLANAPALAIDPDEIPSPLTRPERTEYSETSTLVDVNAFLQQLVDRGAPIRLETLGISAGGREIPLVVCANPMVEDGEAARASGRIVIYLQANIHGGEVEGKEVVQMLLREIAAGEHPSWMERLVLIVTPIYNVDGNEAWGEGLTNRGHQNGPARVGERPNAARLDLNRDGTKAESPEMRAALSGIYQTWDPHVVLDLHTTNGTRHGYTLTYSPPLHPDTDQDVLRFTRDVLLPEARKRLAMIGELTQDYGNVDQRQEVRGWYTFSPLGRYVTNYVGLRNRIGILSEATSYLPFQTRILSTRRFVTTVLDLCVESAEKISTLCQEADRRAKEGDLASLSLSFAPASRGKEAVPLELRGQARPPHQAPLETAEEVLPIFDRFETVSSRSVPAAYWIPGHESRVISLLRRHGIEVAPCRTKVDLNTQEFVFDQVRRRGRPYQGHIVVAAEGTWKMQELNASAANSGYWVSCRQPLVRLVFALLEPDQSDGIVAWSLLERATSEKSPYPIRRVW